MSIGASVSTISPNIPGTSNIVSPYGDDIDTRMTGSVRYTQFTTTDSQISTVSGFIRSQTSAGSFFGARMMVAEWNSVPVYSRNSVSMLDYSILFLLNYIHLLTLSP